jgi:hypothetical protein
MVGLIEEVQAELALQVQVLVFSCEGKSLDQKAVLKMLRPHLPGISLSEVRDLFVITKALVESEADGRAPPPDLQHRLIRAAKGSACKC